MKVGNALFKLMSELGIRQVFGNPGTTELSFLKHMPKDFNYYLALHDGISVGMAEGYYFATRKPQIVNLHSSPGLTNAMGFIYEALISRIPLIVLVGQQYLYRLIDEPVLYGDFIKISQGVVKSAYEIRSEKDAIKTFIRAYKESITPPYGPVLISLPQDIPDMEVSEGEKVDIPKYFVSGTCDTSAIEFVLDKVKSASSIAIVAGYEVSIFSAHEELVRLAEKLNAPIYTEPYLSIFPIDSSNILFKGPLSRYKASDVVKELEKYDLVLVIGGWLNYVVFPDVDIRLNIVEVTSDFKEASKRKWDTIVCNPKDFLIKLYNMLYKGLNKNIIKRENRDLELQGDFITEVFKEMKGYLDKYTIFAEIPTYRDTLIKIIELKPSSLYITRSGLLGWALSALVGYSINGAKVLAIIGDGSFNYTPQALWSAVKYSTRLKVIVINNEGYASLSRHGVEADWLFPSTSPWKVALAYGFEAKESRDIKNDLKWLFEDDKRKLLEIRLARH
ncbi:thiamine pyrophosphate-binding protein [Saccharolobus solfataricus]|uniref:2-oxoacid oxidoreductase (ferredoxin) n=3 Tax=Saccharolobus solfataricus TaxID=2287 RepID=Q97XR3_SACS2|nr:thiamine pyrophosphate-binding protein [Saccharolobus solfataricus]AAK41860.1 Benzoylformate decarboxylase (mdlC) [Saccharolobus solfataricus P2]AKA74592.1 thiamine pyrophosphate-binding protein [Saccharolobus solfataricus]AKA77288.1 thiamine pyrophosphate-binding protein [Saccharolobus solfataricus]AKA79980.1 thiamine pyrophosphate-binding protein [Saccharolobus solfataricus]AZF69062.1 thiamine pyrophosphate-binding protein [Saccharolobus solfataricus]